MESKDCSAALTQTFIASLHVIAKILKETSTHQWMNEWIKYNVYINGSVFRLQKGGKP